MPTEPTNQETATTLPVLDLCAQEPIHQPGCIQPHAVLLCACPQSLRVLAASENFAAVLGKSQPEEGRGLYQYLPQAAADEISRALADETLTGDHQILTLSAEWLPPLGGELRAHLFKDVLFCEIEPLLDEDMAPGGNLLVIQRVLADLERTALPEQLADIAAAGIRELTGMERVLVYRFDSLGHGLVFAENHSRHWPESFKGLRFPADDIPVQARELYKIAPTRFTPRRDYHPENILPGLDPRTDRPFDISRCHCRSLSGVHQIYQANLGVDGALSVSLMIDGDLWGLIIGHHRQPHRVPVPARHLVDRIARALSARLHTAEEEQVNRDKQRHQRMRIRFLEQFSGVADILSAPWDGPVKLTDLFLTSCGAALIYDQGPGKPVVTRPVGITPPEDALLRLADYCRKNLRDGVFAADCLSALLPEFAQYAEHASGVLAIGIGDLNRHLLLWLVPEVPRTEAWGGATPEMVAREKSTGNFDPRRSFSRWLNDVRGHSHRWPAWKIDFAGQLRSPLTRPSGKRGPFIP